MAKESNLGGGVELEWAIVYYSLLQSGITERQMKERNQKIKPYGARISVQAKDAVSQVIEKFGKEILKTAGISKDITPELIDQMLDMFLPVTKNEMFDQVWVINNFE